MSSYTLLKDIIYFSLCRESSLQDSLGCVTVDDDSQMSMKESHIITPPINAEFIMSA